MAEFSQPFSFLFFIVLSLFLSPSKKEVTLIDCISTVTGEVQLMRARPTRAGYRIRSDSCNVQKIDISIQPKKGSEFIFYAIDEKGENESVNLEEIVRRIKPLKSYPVQTVAFPNDTIKFVLSDELLYIYLKRSQKMLVIH